jgi:hypothetical protein
LDIIANNALDVPFLIAFIAKDGSKFKAANNGNRISPAAKRCAYMQQVENIAAHLATMERPDN